MFVAAVRRAHHHRSVDHPAAPKGRKYVRVHSYISEMVMHPHAGIDEVSLDSIGCNLHTGVVWGVVYLFTRFVLPPPPPPPPPHPTHTHTLSQMGFDFELTYFDDPQTNLPSSCVNWVATAGKHIPTHHASYMYMYTPY